ncbi:electron transfer flavoprotein subunit beta/FixA family protein [Halobacteriovorax sp. GB3]|uniref:electron transfer flavoprotein subunit beta/FixA family protein n=1 Tax=Halobacteriovorax sp. GB3 TaxID=2719615 RepID=UPI0023602BFC|nr:electron transfer flavoprotein subunit beta/FixA family protein [Halobacteriovorax sp. GB3]MDD0854781.1 electron transfer flavoprotein subunit beta/FixA family protein [Halobacteriovorax sp. GB3]
MNIFVCIKQVPDTETKITPKADGSFIETTSIKWIMNPYDEFAVEQALLTKQANSGSTVTVVRVGGVKDTEALRTALAMGADEAILVEGDDNLDSFMTAKAIKGAIEKSGKTPDVVFTGKQAIDDDCLQVPQLVAQMMDLPHVSVVVECNEEGGKYTLKREIEGGAMEVYEVNAPVVIACNKGLNTPRYASLPGIMKAKRKPLTQHSLADVGVSEDDRRVKYSGFQLPPEKPAGKKFDAMEEANQASIVADVVKLLREEAKVI